MFFGTDGWGSMKTLSFDSACIIQGAFDQSSESGQVLLDRFIQQIEQLPKPVGKLDVKSFEAGVAILDSRPDDQKRVLLAGLERIKHTSGSAESQWRTYRACDALLRKLLRRKLPISESDAGTLLKAVVSELKIYPMSELPTALMVTAVGKYVDKHGLSKQLRCQFEKIKNVFHRQAADADARKIGDTVESILELYPVENKESKPAELKIGWNSEFERELATGEVWTSKLIDYIRGCDDCRQSTWMQFLRHCQKAKSSKPSKTWRKEATEFLSKNWDCESTRFLTEVFEAVGEPGKPEYFVHGGYSGYHDETQIHSKHVDMLRGMVWITAQIDQQTLVISIANLAEKCFQKITHVGPRCPKIGNACLTALSDLATESAVAQLGRLKVNAKHASTRKQIERAYDRAAEKVGVNKEELLELAVPDFGMQETGVYKQLLGGCEVVVRVTTAGKFEQTWTNLKGKAQKSVPAIIKNEFTEEWKNHKRKVKEMEGLIPSIRKRLERLFVAERRWKFSEFRKRYLNHPLVGAIARRLIWNFERKQGSCSLIFHDGEFLNSQDEEVDEKQLVEAEVSLWHPMHASAEDVLAWRDWLFKHQVVQPFKQAHREIYVLTDAEMETCFFSNRFAAHVLRQHQLNALCQQRGWRYDLQGDWCSWNQPTMEIPGTDLCVEFDVEPPEAGEVTDHMVYVYVTSGQVRFRRAAENSSAAGVRLADVPPLIFSEVMRDIDLFVGISSAGNDPEWHLNESERVRAYQANLTSGELSESARTRLEVLKSIVPNLKIADRCRFQGNFLLVEGKIRTYKIHLGSGNILMEPNGQYLCIVRKTSSTPRNRVFLPFEGDATLSLIVSKAILLADDDKIKDRTISSQIQRH